MDLAYISSFFKKSVPIGIVFLIAHQVYLGNEIKHINKKLDNHITDTHKKIDRLSDRFDRLSDRFDNLYDHLIKNK